MSYALGLDFGTTFTAAAIVNDGVVRVATLGNRAGAVPAAVFVRPDGSLLHGEDAYMRGASEPLQLARNLKRRLGQSEPITIGGVDFDPTQLVADHLRWAVGRVVEREGGPPDRMVLTHPASWRSGRLEGFRQAIDQAGLQPDLITEPHAAATFHAESHPLAVGDLVAAYDLGGGTFDAAVLRRTRHGFELAGEPEGEDHLGGIDFDEVVLHLVQARLGERWRDAKREGGHAFDTAVAALRRECVAAKEALSVEEEVDVPVMLPGLIAPVHLARRDFEHLIGPAIEETIGSFRRAVAGAGAEMSDLSAALLVGASCRLPIVRRSVEEAVGSEVTLLDADPKHAVARGAAVAAGELVAPVHIGADARHAVSVVSTGATQSAHDRTATADAPANGSAGSDGIVVIPDRHVARDGVAVNGDSVDGGHNAAPIDPAPESRIRQLWPLALLALLLVLAFPLIWFFTRDSGDEPEIATNDFVINDPGESGQFSDTESAPSDPVSVVLPSGVDMVEVAAGTYSVGVDDPGPESVAAFTVTVDSFHIDQFEVTNEQYVAFVNQIGAPAPFGWDQGAIPSEDANRLPVVGVEFVWAEAYCGALGKRLPSEAEWEVAARGPAGTLYPAGPTPEGLDLDQPGLRPVGSTAANFSGFGVYDTVGSVWEWVGAPYQPVDDGQVVRRGGQYGRVRDGTAMRQAVDPAGQATVAETGFRCAADDVDANAAALDFDAAHQRPEDARPVPGPVQGGNGGDFLVDDSFDDTRSGFAEVEAAEWRIGYHAPSWYHVEAARDRTQVVALGGFNLADGDVELSAYVDQTDSESGAYRYGLVFRAGGAIEAPPDGVAGPPRPDVYYAFVVNPRAGVWELLHQDELPQRVQASGTIDGLRVTDPDAPDVLGLSMRGSDVVFRVNGEDVGTFDTRGFHDGAGNIGLYVETFDESLVHVHYDRLTVS